MYEDIERNAESIPKARWVAGGSDRVAPDVYLFGTVSHLPSVCFSIVRFYGGYGAAKRSVAIRIANRYAAA